MRSAIGFLSLLAFGCLVAGVLTVVGSGPLAESAFGRLMGTTHGGVHLGSLLIGLVLGVVLSALARVSWAELPGRFVGWMLAYERAFYRMALVGVLIGALVFY